VPNSAGFNKYYRTGEFLTAWLFIGLNATVRPGFLTEFVLLCRKKVAMLQVSFIKEQTTRVIEGLKKKHVKNPEELVGQVLATDKQRRELQVMRDAVLAESNTKAREIGDMMKAGKKAEAEEFRTAAAALKAKAKDLSDQVDEAENKLTELLYLLPNVPHESVPEGKSAEDNEVVFQVATLPALGNEAKPHWDLIETYDIIDFALGTKVTGAGFPFYKGYGARLQRAMINFFLDEAEKAGYREIQAPIVVNTASATGTGQLPDKEGQMYKMEGHDFYLIPTAEVPLTNIYRDVILSEEELPVKLAGYTPCFRREAGSWGAHVRGLNRLHQFDKVEIVQIQHPDRSYDALIDMRNHVEGLLKKLELPYRILKLCGGDISFNAALCFDMEVYAAAQQKWLEVSSVSNFETFQANRLMLRYRQADKKINLAHTLNGSALALPRIMAALLENNQTPEGIVIPEVLRPYCGFDKITRQAH
jgi:seryl-tRNA synthetase